MSAVQDTLTDQGAFTREDMVDAIATAISDSMDVDWNSHTGAEAVVRNCGVFELYEALDLAYRGGMVDMAGSDFRDRVEAILLKVRGND